MQPDSPDKTLVFIANGVSNDLATLELSPDGSLRLLHLTPLGGPVNCLAVHPDRRSLYAAIKNPKQIVSLAIHSGGAAPEVLSVIPAPADFCYMRLDHQGRFLLCASYHDYAVASLPVSRQGFAVANGAALLTPGRNPHCILTDNANRFAYVPCLGSDEVRAFRFDPDTGDLAPAPAPATCTRRQAGPRHMVFSPDNRYAYVLAELSGEVLHYVVDPASGALVLRHGVSIQHADNPLPASTYTPPANQVAGGNSPHPVMWAADLHLTPDGRYLYVSERTRSLLTCFGVDAITGRLDFLGTTKTEEQPRSFAIDPKGRFLIACGEKSGHATAYRIDAATGGLRETGRVEVGERPDWVEVVNFR